MAGYQQMSRGFTLMELMIAVTLAGLVLAAMSGIVSTVLGTDDVVTERNRLQQDARFAMDRMVNTAGHTRKLLLPLPDNPNTNWPENIREQTIPASSPVGDSTFASAVLAVTLPEYVDLNADGLADADDDGDGRIDEDLPNDIHHDFFPGIMLIDDDGDGSIDENPSLFWDDDEDGTYNEDPFGNIDNDGDGAFSEDPPSDINSDGCPGLCGVDDDQDGTIDGGNKDNDDEEGTGFEDAYDPIVFYLDGDSLIERMPVPWNADGISSPDGPVDGRDFVESVIADSVTHFRVERPVVSASGEQLVELLLELTGPTGEVVSVTSRVRIGGVL
jgi:prepilin-type N-terminal cleavage/methylation domain-containing protein